MSTTRTRTEGAARPAAPSVVYAGHAALLGGDCLEQPQGRYRGCAHPKAQDAPPARGYSGDRPTAGVRSSAFAVLSGFRHNHADDLLKRDRASVNEQGFDLLCVEMLVENLPHRFVTLSVSPVASCANAYEKLGRSGE